jgi:hypothetical protein
MKARYTMLHVDVIELKIKLWTYLEGMYILYVDATYLGLRGKEWNFPCHGNS